jgi:hypothetical protein
VPATTRRWHSAPTAQARVARRDPHPRAPGRPKAACSRVHRSSGRRRRCRRIALGLVPAEKSSWSREWHWPVRPAPRQGPAPCTPQTMSSNCLPSKSISATPPSLLVGPPKPGGRATVERGNCITQRKAVERALARTRGAGLFVPLPVNTGMRFTPCPEGSLTAS